MDVAEIVPDAELVIGLVTPVGTNTGHVAERLRTALSHWNYRSHVIKVTDFFNKQDPPSPGEFEDHRVLRLIKAGNDWCHKHEDASAVARLAIVDIRSVRRSINRQKAGEGGDEQLDRPALRTAYVIHSLKRPDEVQLLRRVYGDQFVLVGCQASQSERFLDLSEKALSASDPANRDETVRHLMEIDASEEDRFGQKVNETFPQPDYFLRSDEDPDRLVSLLFGDTSIAPTPGELMYLAHAASLQSLSASRRVGATLVADGSVISVGCNEVPEEERSDIETGEDASELFKLELLRDTLQRLQKEGFIQPDFQLDPTQLTSIKSLLDESQIMSVIEYQRSVHAEVAAISNAARRGTAVEGTDLYCTTYPCHLCFKAALAVGINRIYYIHPYPKSRADLLFPLSGHRLLPYEGVAPRMYLRAFGRPLAKTDETGKFIKLDKSSSSPHFLDVHEPKDLMEREAQAVTTLRLNEKKGDSGEG